MEIHCKPVKDTFLVPETCLRLEFRLFCHGSTIHTNVQSRVMSVSKSFKLTALSLCMFNVKGKKSTSWLVTLVARVYTCCTPKVKAIILCISITCTQRNASNLQLAHTDFGADYAPSYYSQRPQALTNSQLTNTSKSLSYNTMRSYSPSRYSTGKCFHFS